MKFSSRGKYVYTPEFYQNKELPEEECLSVEIIRPKAEERADLFSMDVEREVGQAEISGSSPTKASVTFKRRYNVSKILRNHIGKIINLQEDLGDDGKGGSIVNAVVDGKSLAESKMFGIQGLIDELCIEVLSDILEPDEKKSSK